MKSTVLFDLSTGQDAPQSLNVYYGFYIGVVWIPTCIPARVLTISLWMTLLVVSTTYQGDLIASLTTQRPSLPFTTLEEVAEDTQYTLLIRPDQSHSLRYGFRHSHITFCLAVKPRSLNYQTIICIVFWMLLKAKKH